VFGVYPIPDGTCYRVAIDRNGPSARTVILSDSAFTLFGAFGGPMAKPPAGE